MSASVKHQPATPLPGTVEMHAEHGLFLLSAKRDMVAEFYAVIDTAKPFGQQNAAYYNHAANAYPKLVAALSELIGKVYADDDHAEKIALHYRTATEQADDLLRELGEA
jgi:hypothetical protein